MNVPPAVFLGNIQHSSQEQRQDYFTALHDFFKDYRDTKFLIVESTSDCSENEYVLSYDTDFQDTQSLEILDSIVQEYKGIKKIEYSFSETIKLYCSLLHLNPKQVVHLVLNETNSHHIMELGQKLQKVREANFLLIGLGNITVMDTKTDEQVTKATREFDAWVRVKLWEFDYYALRDIETYFPFKKNLYLEDFHSYAPFLLVFGSLFGTDILHDLYAGFTQNRSLRSFYFSA